MPVQMPPLMLPVLTPQTEDDTQKLSFTAFMRAYDYILVGSVPDTYLPQETVIPKGQSSALRSSVYS